MKLPELKIGPFTARVPLIQGGMSIRVSTSKLVIPVANCGGIGVIGGSAVPPDEVYEDVLLAKAGTDGIVAVNIMFAMVHFPELVQRSIDAGVDIIITGAGFSRDIYKIGRAANVPIVSIVSSAGLARLAEKLGAAAIIVEAKEAGGHLGTDVALRELFPPIRDVVKNVPCIAAGGITNGYEMAELMDKYGADGIQIASRFVLSEECDVSDEFKQIYLDSKREDIQLVTSPVGMPGRAFMTPFTKKLAAGGDVRTKGCKHDCIKKCSRRYCINERLDRARIGDVENGLFFTGENSYKMDSILPVSEIFEQFVTQAESVYKEH